MAAGYDLGDPAGTRKALDELFAILGDGSCSSTPTTPATRSAPAATATAPSAPAPSATPEFAAILAHPSLATLPVITETTGDPDQMAADLTRLNRLRPVAAAPAGDGSAHYPTQTRRNSTTTSPQGPWYSNRRS